MTEIEENGQRKWKTRREEKLQHTRRVSKYRHNGLNLTLERVCLNRLCVKSILCISTCQLCQANTTYLISYLLILSAILGATGMSGCSRIPPTLVHSFLSMTSNQMRSVSRSVPCRIGCRRSKYRNCGVPAISVSQQAARHISLTSKLFSW